MQGWNTLVGKLSFRAGIERQEPVLTVGHKMVMEKSTKNYYSLALQNTTLMAFSETTSYLLEV